MAHHIYTPLPLNLTHAVFDVDQTLYPFSTGFQAEHLDKTLFEYAEKAMTNHPKNSTLTRVEIQTLISNFYKQYGSTILGVSLYLGLDERSFFNDWLSPKMIDYSKLKVCQNTREQLCLLRGHKLRLALFTNSTDLHGHRVVASMGLDGLFSYILGINSHQEFMAKPQAAAFHSLLWELNTTPEKVMFFEDSLHNLAASRSMGFGYNVYIGENEPETPKNENRVFDLWAQTLPEALTVINAVFEEGKLCHV